MMGRGRRWRRVAAEGVEVRVVPKAILGMTKCQGVDVSHAGIRHLNCVQADRGGVFETAMGGGRVHERAGDTCDVMA